MPPVPCALLCRLYKSLTKEFILDDDTHSTGLWSKLTNIFTAKNEDNLEQAILEAQTDGELKAEEGSMLLSILTLDELQVQDIMTPRTDIECIPSHTTLRDAGAAIAETGHSRLPIYQETRDNIIGIAYAKDMLPYLIFPEKHSEPVNSIMRPPFFVPETKIASELLQEFRGRKTHLAIVVDEYGGTSGLVTIEDLLEVIVGEIEDEHDAPREEEITKIAENEYDIAGRAFLEDLEEYGLLLESEEVDTLGGYLSFICGHVPQEGEEIRVGEWVFKVTEADAKQIRKIHASKSDEEPGDES